MKILICGLGSIGERHARNLLALGVKDLMFYRQRQLPLRTVSNDFPVFSDLDEALARKPDVAFVCNPTHLHLETAIRCVRGGCHVFVEKPLSHSPEGLNTLQHHIENSGKKLMVGYMMRFHPCLKKAEKWIVAGEIGRVIYYRSSWGEYLPDWHPYEDYRESYAARREMGGGPILTLSHEFDMMLWLVGDYEKTMALANYASHLELSTEHGVDALFKLCCGGTASVHLDYFQTPAYRITEIVGTRGRILFDYYGSRVVRFGHGKTEPVTVMDISGDFDRNELFLGEVRYFLRSLSSQDDIVPGFREGAKVVHLAAELERKCVHADH